jgi:hypothetical protein
VPSLSKLDIGVLSSFLLVKEADINFGYIVVNYKVVVDADCLPLKAIAARLRMFDFGMLKSSD